jgi:Putative DNA-binding domain
VPFNPFTKDIGTALTAQDLNELLTKEVAEGLYVEHKETFPSNDKIGNSLASFANSYGGWYLVGVAADNTKNTPTAICGFRVVDYPDPIAKVREIAKSRIDPTPAIEPQLVSLTATHSVLVARIPGYQDKPFISTNGRIYRRQADSSDPISERDRYAIDKLYEEGREPAKDFEHFVQDDLNSDDDYEGWLKIFLAPSPERISAKDIWTFDTANDLLERSRQPRNIPMFGVKEITGNAPYTSCQPSHESLVLSQRPVLQPSSVSPRLELFNDGRGKISCPLVFSSLPTDEEIAAFTSEEVRDVFRALRRSGNVDANGLRFLDAGLLFATLGTQLSFYLEWLANKGTISDFRVAARLLGIRKVVPFFDSEDWAEHVNKYGFPISERKEISIPSGRKRSLLWDASPDADASLLQMLCYLVGNSLGLPYNLQTRAFFGKYASTAMGATG